MRAGLPAAADAAWVATLPDEFVAAGIGVRYEAGDFRRVGDDPRVFDKVVEVSFGGPHRFQVKRAEGAGPLRVALLRGAAGWEVAFAAADGKELAMRIDTDSEALIRDVQSLEAEAESAKARRQFGVAITKFQQLAGFHPQGAPSTAAIEEQWRSLDRRGKDDLAELQAQVDGAVKFRDAEELVRAREVARRLATEFEGHDAGRGAAKETERIDKALADVARARAEFLAAPLLRKANDFLARRPRPMTALAKAFLEEIVERFPGTEAEKKAKEQLAKL